MNNLSVIRGPYIKKSLQDSMKSIKITTKRKSRIGFIESQILKIKASKNKVFVFTVIATLMVFVK
jgi:hypothetical protein